VVKWFISFGLLLALLLFTFIGGFVASDALRAQQVPPPPGGVTAIAAPTPNLHATVTVAVEATVRALVPPTPTATAPPTPRPTPTATGEQVTVTVPTYLDVVALTRQSLVSMRDWLALANRAAEAATGNNQAYLTFTEGATLRRQQAEDLLRSLAQVIPPEGYDDLHAELLSLVQEYRDLLLRVEVAIGSREPGAIQNAIRALDGPVGRIADLERRLDQRSRGVTPSSPPRTTTPVASPRPAPPR
jgi:hypothetical protein